MSDIRVLSHSLGLWCSFVSLPDIIPISFVLVFLFKVSTTTQYKVHNITQLRTFIIIYLGGSLKRGSANTCSGSLLAKNALCQPLRLSLSEALSGVIYRLAPPIIDEHFAIRHSIVRKISGPLPRRINRL